jgi:uncharacterized protein YbjT (DUF2867 family)
MSSKQINIFLTGATGYIGGSILTGLLQHPNVSNFKISVLVRGDENRVKKIAALGVTPVVGSNDSHDIIEKAASESHVIFILVVPLLFLKMLTARKDRTQSTAIWILIKSIV